MSNTQLEAIALVVAGMADVDTRLAYTPNVIKYLTASGMGQLDAQHLLWAADKAGLIELRPESGMGRLSLEDKWTCPKRTDGTPLSYIRVR